jgi:tRNA pseudouridine38-40 synthase
MKMRTIALVVEYDGTGYHGFQRQTTLPTIASELEAALRVLCGHDVSIVGAGRTDAGVHATGQVVSLETGSDVRLERMPIALSAMLRSKRIAVLRAVPRPVGFSARHDALARTYLYRILNRVAPSPLQEHRAFFVRSPLDVAAMSAAAQALLGEHDFSAFCAQLPTRGRPARTLERLEISRRGDVVELEVTADSFLHQMVRIIAGTLVDVGRGKRPPEEVAAILGGRDRAKAGATAPAHGLYLTGVRYRDPL